jgi:hypothetical protein
MTGMSLSVLGSVPRIPAMNMKSPARVARFQVPVGLMAPCGDSVFTSVEETRCATEGLAAIVMAHINAAEMFDTALLDNRVCSEVCRDD